MNKKSIGIITIIAIIIVAVGIGAYYFASPQYKTFSDQKIQVEIPSEFEFETINNDTPYVNMTTYHTSDDNNGIIVFTMSPNLPSASELYSTTMETFEKILNPYKINGSEYNYNGTMYKLENRQTLNIPGYAILHKYPDKLSYIVVVSNDPDTAIQMAETIQLK